jgi:Spy/CpxP family protein refolding chaperone
VNIECIRDLIKETVIRNELADSDAPGEVCLHDNGKGDSMLARLLLSAVLATTLAYAQRGGGGGSRNNPSSMGAEMPRVQRLSRTDQIADKLKLNKDQKEQLLNILSAAREEAAPIREQMDKARTQIAGSMIDGKDDDSKKLLDAYPAVAAQMAGLEAKTFSKIFAILKPNQQGKAEQAFELMAGMFNAAPTNMSGRGGSGRSERER